MSFRSIFALLLLASSIAGLSIFGVVVYMQGPPPRNQSRYWLWPIVCAMIAIPTAVHLWRKRHEAPGKPQLFMPDLLFISFGFALHLAIVQRFVPTQFVRFGLLGGVAVLAGGVVSCLRASRCGYAYGAQRWMFAGGTFLTYLGMALLAPMIFLAVLCLFLGSAPEDVTRSFGRAFLFGAPAAVAGFVLCRVARNRS